MSDEPIKNPAPVKNPEQQGVAERYFESMLWNSRFTVLLAVLRV